MDERKMDPNPIEPILFPTLNPVNDLALKTVQKYGYNLIWRCPIIDYILFLLDSYQDTLNVDQNTNMKGTVIVISGKKSCHCKGNNSFDPHIINECLCTKEMKCNVKMKDCLLNHIKNWQCLSRF